MHGSICGAISPNRTVFQKSTSVLASRAALLRVVGIRHGSPTGGIQGDAPKDELGGHLDEVSVLHAIKVDMSHKMIRRHSDQFDAHRW